MSLTEILFENFRAVAHRQSNGTFQVSNERLVEAVMTVLRDVGDLESSSARNWRIKSVKSHIARLTAQGSVNSLDIFRKVLETTSIVITDETWSSFERQLREAMPIPAIPGAIRNAAIPAVRQPVRAAPRPRLMHPAAANRMGMQVEETQLPQEPQDSQDSAQEPGEPQLPQEPQDSAQEPGEPQLLPQGKKRRKVYQKLWYLKRDKKRLAKQRDFFQRSLHGAKRTIKNLGMKLRRRDHALDNWRSRTTARRKRLWKKQLKSKAHVQKLENITKDNKIKNI